MERGCKTHSGNKASQFFCMLVLSLLVSLASRTQLTPAWIAFSTKAICPGVDWVLLARVPCLHASVNCLASFHATWAVGYLFGQLSNHLRGCIAFMPFKLLANPSVSCIGSKFTRMSACPGASFTWLMARDGFHKVLRSTSSSAVQI